MYIHVVQQAETMAHIKTNMGYEKCTTYHLGPLSWKLLFSREEHMLPTLPFYHRGVTITAQNVGTMSRALHQCVLDNQ